MSELYKKVIHALTPKLPSFASFLSHRTGSPWIPKPKALKYDSGTVKFRFLQKKKDLGDKISSEYFLHIKVGADLCQLDVTAGLANGQGQITTQKVFPDLSIATLTPQRVFGWITADQSKKTLSEIIGTLALLHGLSYLHRAFKGRGKSSSPRTEPHRVRGMPQGQKERILKHKDPLSHSSGSLKLPKEKFKRKYIPTHEAWDPDGDPVGQAGPNNDPTHGQQARHFTSPSQPNRKPKEASPPSPLGHRNTNVAPEVE